jgi:hypothetical protein
MFEFEKVKSHCGRLTEPSVRNTELEDTLSFTYQTHESGSVPTAMRDRWTEGEVIYGKSRCRKLYVTVLVFMRRNNTRNTWL